MNISWVLPAKLTLMNLTITSFSSTDTKPTKEYENPLPIQLTRSLLSVASLVHSISFIMMRTQKAMTYSFRTTWTREARPWKMATHWPTNSMKLDTTARNLTKRKKR